MICFLAAVSSDTALLRVLAARRTGACPPGLSGSAAVLRRFEGISGGRGSLTSGDGPRARHVDGHLLEQGVDSVELEGRAQPRTEVERDPLAVEVEAGSVQAVRLHAALRPVEGRVGADADGRRQALARRAEQPARVDAVSGYGRVPAHVQVGCRVAELTASVVAVDDQALHTMRSAQDGHRRLRVALGDALADVRGGPSDVALADQVDTDHLEAQRLAQLDEGLHAPH